MAFQFRFISLSKPHLSKHFLFNKHSKIPKSHFCFYSSSPHKPPNEEYPDPYSHISTRKSQPGTFANQESAIPGENNRNPSNIEDVICRILEDNEWPTRLQTSTRGLFSLFNHNLVYNVLNRTPNHALEFFEWVEGSGFKHDRETHYKMIEILCRDRRVDEAKRILFSMSKKGLDYDEELFILLIHGYAKSNRKWDIVKNCVKIFSKMEELGVPRTIKSYNVLLQVIIRENKYTMTKKFFDKMPSEGVIPNSNTYTLMISGFCKSSRVETAKQFFKDMENQNLSPDDVIYNAMINGYVHVKKMEEAEKMLTEMKERKIEPNLITYNSMINGYVKVKRVEGAAKLVVEMKGLKINPNLITYNTMINGYALVGKMDDAKEVMEEMKEMKIKADLSTYIAMIRGFVAINRVDYGLDLLEEMKRGRFGDDVDFNFCLGLLREGCDDEKMTEAQRNVLQAVEDCVERLELLALRDAARELSELASKRVVGERSKVKMDGVRRR